MCRVLQGCQFSGTVFEMTLIPLLKRMQTQLGQRRHTCIRACADHIGVATYKLSVLNLLYLIFKLAEIITGLRLTPSKRVLVPAGEILSEELSLRITGWLVLNIQEWQAFRIRLVGKYLGCWLGPESSLLCWQSPMKKWKDRAKAIAAAKAPPSISAMIYKIGALPILMYVAQRIPLLSISAF